MRPGQVALFTGSGRVTRATCPDPTKNLTRAIVVLRKNEFSDCFGPKNGSINQAMCGGSISTGCAAATQR